ncbi:MAG: carboxymuconolactone decarboxylase family protein [Anaeroplasma sp.]
MNITDKAMKNHEKLFPEIGVTDTLDEELIEILLNFNFDEVLEHESLDERTRQMVILAVTIASQTPKRYEIFLKAALNVGVTPIEIKEILYQSVPYVGVLKVLDLLEPTNKIFEERGIKLPLEKQGTTTRENRFDKGLEVQKSIFGDVIDKAYESSPKEQVHIQKFLSDNCFGDYYTRNGLDVKTRELITFSILLAQSGLEPQLKGHIQGNLNVGNDKQKLLDTATALLPYVGYPRTLNAIRCINEVAK